MLSDLGTFDEPPNAFRIFRAGVNTTTKGNFLFDAEAAASVMHEFKLHGADLMIDLNHDSLDKEVRKARVDALDARGWCALEVRETPEGPELWACNVQWTPDGAERLRSKKQRYVSPVFADDPKTGRVLHVVNIALCAMPATDHAMPLVAATVRADEYVARRDAAIVRADEYIARRLARQ